MSNMSSWIFYNGVVRTALKAHSVFDSQIARQPKCLMQILYKNWHEPVPLSHDRLALANMWVHRLCAENELLYTNSACSNSVMKQLKDVVHALGSFCRPACHSDYTRNARRRLWTPPT